MNRANKRRGGGRSDKKNTTKNGRNIFLNEYQQSTSRLRHCPSDPHAQAQLTPCLYSIAIVATEA